MAQQLLVLTPEKTLITYPLAGVPSRALAHLFDAIVLIFLMALAYFVLPIPFAFVDPGLAQAVVAVVTSALPFAYFIVLEGLWNGQTLGKKAMGLRVRMADGTPVTFVAALGRNLLRPADFLPIGYFVGTVAMFTNTRSQRLGDMVVGSVVIHDRSPKPNFTPAPYALGVHAFENHVGDLRRMTVEEYNALKRLCDRAPDLPAGVQDRLVRDVWQPIASKHGIRPIPNVHPIYLAEATVMKYGRTHGLM